MKAVRTLKSQAGFSLIELMIVVAIIGILASIAVPNFQKFQRKAKQTEGKGMLASIYTAEKSFSGEWNTYVACVPEIGVSADGKGYYSTGFGTQTVKTATGSAIPVAGCPATSKFAKPVAANGIVLVDPVAASSDVNTATTFTAAASGVLGGGATDVWQLTDAKVLSNLTSGL
jgi:type IV pilus assembly protein PilA